MHRPEITPHVTFLYALRGDIVAGRLAASSFGRPYEWVEADVERWWAGLMLGMPTGPYLVWQPPRDVATAEARATFGPVRVPTERSGHLLLDGHARLATYLWSMHDLDREPMEAGSPAEAALWTSGRRLAVDVGERRVRFVDASEPSRDPRLMPAHILRDSRRLYVWQRDGMKGGAIRQEDADWLDLVAHVTCNAAKAVVTTLSGHDRAGVAQVVLHASEGGNPWTAGQLDGVRAFGRRAQAVS